MTTKTEALSPAMIDGLRAFYVHRTANYTGGEAGPVERLNEMGGTLHGQFRYTPGMRPQTMEALRGRGLVATHYDPSSSHGSRHYRLTASGHAIVRSLFSDAELAEIDTYWQEQAMAEDLIRDQLADEAARGVGGPRDLSRTDERSRRYWVDQRMREGFEALTAELRDADMPCDFGSVRRELTRHQAAKHPSQTRVLSDVTIVEASAVLYPPCPDWTFRSVTPLDVIEAQQRAVAARAESAGSAAEADERGEIHRNRELAYAEELQALSLPELIDRYARTYHRAANQPNNAELDAQCSMIKQLIGRALEGWVPLDDIESWCDR